MITTALSDVGLALLILAVIAAIFDDLRGSLCDGLLATGNLLIAIADMAGRDWAGAAVSLALAAFCGWNWRRRNRKRSPRSIGGKARALLAALVKKMRESLKPGPVLRPIPGGAV